MFNNLSALIIDGKAVTSLSINGKIVWRSTPDVNLYNILRTADNRLFTTANGRYFVVESRGK